MTLKNLLKGISEYRIYGEEKVEVKGVVDDSRKITRGCLFIAIKGEHTDANNFIPSLVKNSSGASVIVGTVSPEEDWLDKITYVRVKDDREALGIIASNWYGNPSKKLKVIGVTGSDGKTTTSHMIYEILRKAGKKAGLISTIAARIGNISLDTGFHVTNPEPLSLQKYLDQMVKDGIEYVVLETTSHGISQKRTAGVKYNIAVLTNITHEHLDYHKTFENYRDTKLKLFLDAKTSILNKDDKSYSYFNKKIKAEKISYSISGKADYFASSIVINEYNMQFKVHDVKHEWSIKTKITGEYNVENALAAIAVAKKLRISWESIIDALSTMKPPKGRLEMVPNNKGFDIFIDFAHTPNALEKVLTLLISHAKGKLIVVFGCASERDMEKRPMMGRIATDIADVSIFTAEDPRKEDINKILKEMEAGITNKKAVYYKIPERGEAIFNAINKHAKFGDTIVICGKAHEQSMSYNGVEYPWSDFKAVEMALEGEIFIIKR